MKKRIFTGAGTALVTPFNEDYSVNYDALRFLVNDQIEKGIDSLIICGTTGEGSTLTHEEHVKVIAEAIEVAGGRVPIIAGSGSNDTAYSVKLSKEVAALGADVMHGSDLYAVFPSGCTLHSQTIADVNADMTGHPQRLTNLDVGEIGGCALAPLDHLICVDVRHAA